MGKRPQGRRAPAAQDTKPPRRRKDKATAPPRTRQLKKETAPPRNKPCPCNSGKKFKACCGKPPATATSIYSTARMLYTPDQRRAESAFIKQWGIVPNLSQLGVFAEEGEAAAVEMMIDHLKRVGAEPRVLYAVQTCRMLLTPRNVKMHRLPARQAWDAALAEYEGSHPDG